MHTPSTVSCPRRETRPQPGRNRDHLRAGVRVAAFSFVAARIGCLQVGRGEYSPGDGVAWVDIGAATATHPPAILTAVASALVRRGERRPIRPARARLHSFDYRHESSAAERSSGHSSARERYATDPIARPALSPGDRDATYARSAAPSPLSAIPLPNGPGGAMPERDERLATVASAADPAG
jgi:hypothetical protein